jgi:hypothetical protein
MFDYICSFDRHFIASPSCGRSSILFVQKHEFCISICRVKLCLLLWLSRKTVTTSRTIPQTTHLEPQLGHFKSTTTHSIRMTHTVNTTPHDLQHPCDTERELGRGHLKRKASACIIPISLSPLLIMKPPSCGSTHYCMLIASHRRWKINPPNRSKERKEGTNERHSNPIHIIHPSCIELSTSMYKVHTCMMM